MRMARCDVLVLIGFCLVLFGISLVGGRALTMHESVLPQCTREMRENHEWLIPTSGGRPWLHRPPLPHWVMLAVTAPLGAVDAAWKVRLAPLVMSTCVVLMTAWLAGRWFGRNLGLLSGLVLATAFQFTRYAWLAEEDTTLCAAVTATVTLFAYLEFFAPDHSAQQGVVRRWFGWHGWPLMGFFTCLGLTNMAKGLIFGPLLATVPIALFLVSTLEPRRLQKYFWAWGWLATAIAGGLWPAYVYLNYPDVLDMWIYDYGGRLNGGYIGEPWWYYWATLPWALLPWTPLVIAGLAITFRKAWLARSLPERFLWCWSVGTVAFFSIPDGKHHHYLVPCLPPWAMLGALGLAWARQRIVAWESPLKSPSLAAAVVGLGGGLALWMLRAKIPGPDWIVPLGMLLLPMATFLLAWAWQQPHAIRGGVVAFAVLVAVYGAGYVYVGRYLEHGREDWEFLMAVRDHARTAKDPMYVNAELRSCLEVNRVLIHLDRDTRTIHNLSYLLDAELQPETILLVTLARDQARLARVGEPRVILQSTRSRRELSPGERLTLFEVRLDPERPRFSNHLPIRQQQIKHREPGPFLGGLDPKDWTSLMPGRVLSASGPR
jgi:4-amino-4-deoxy-L-arabinose transferase-like glycosyltransferase